MTVFPELKLLQYDVGIKNQMLDRDSEGELAILDDYVVDLKTLGFDYVVLFVINLGVNRAWERTTAGFTRLKPNDITIRYAVLPTNPGFGIARVLHAIAHELGHVMGLNHPWLEAGPSNPGAIYTTPDNSQERLMRYGLGLRLIQPEWQVINGNS